MDDRGTALEFMVGPHSVVVPAALVERVLEVDLSPPPPLSRPWVGGLGVGEGALFVAIDLTIGPRATGRATCVLLDTGAKPGVRWALRVTRTVGFCEVKRCPRSSALPAEWPTWVVGAESGSEVRAGLLDVAGMARAFEA